MDLRETELSSNFSRCYRVRDDINCCECSSILWNCAVNYTCPITPKHTYSYAWLISLLTIGTFILSTYFIFLRSKRNRRMYDEVGVDPLTPRGYALRTSLHSLRNWSAHAFGLNRNRISNDFPMTSI